jgi:hypothetical protein
MIDIKRWLIIYRKCNVWLQNGIAAGWVRVGLAHGNDRQPLTGQFTPTISIKLSMNPFC